MRYNTGNPVGPDGSNSPFDLFDNSGVLDLLLSGSSLEYLNRLGIPLRSWLGIMQQVTDYLIAQGYESVYLAYGVGVVVERQTQLVQRNGELYRVMNASDIPLTLTGTWATDAPKLQAVGDSALRQALASSTGSSMVGFRERTVADRLNDTANVKDYGAIADGTYHPLSERFISLVVAQLVYPHATSLTDSIDWAAYQAAINTGCPNVYAPGGHYVLNKGTICNRHINYMADGVATRIDLSMAGAGGAILTQGDLTQIGNLGANVVRGDRKLTFSAAPDVVPGDVVILYNPTDGSWLTDRPSYRAGEMFRVHSVSGNDVIVYGNSTSNYASASMQVYRMRGVNVTVDNMHFSPSDTFSIAAFKVTFGDRVRASRMYASDVTLYTAVEFDRCFDVMAQTISTPNRSPSVNDEYGLTISNCHNYTVSAANGSATRHAVAIGGNDVACCIPNRNGLLYGLILENIDLAADTYAGDMHGNCDNTTYDNCIFRNGVLMSGRNPTIRNSTIYGVSSTSGECVYGTECQGGVYTIENCRLVSYGDGFATGLIHISPSSSLVEGLLLTVRNITVEAPNATANTDVVCLRPRGATQNCNALVTGLQLRAATARSFLRADDQVLATMNSGYLIVDDVFGPAGTALILASAKITSVPTKQMRQTGSVNVSISATPTIAATAQSFRYPYSKMPNACVGVSSQTGSDQGVIGAVAPVPVVYSVSPTAVRPAIVSSSGNFPASGSAKLHWEVSIDEV